MLLGSTVVYNADFTNLCDLETYVTIEMKYYVINSTTKNSNSLQLMSEYLTENYVGKSNIRRHLIVLNPLLNYLILFAIYSQLLIFGKIMSSRRSSVKTE